MAKKRMISNQIVDSDAFLDMPLSAQALYLHLLVRADDEGFSNNYRKVLRMIRATEDDLKILVAKNFVILFESGVLVIKHWLIHNTIRKDRIIETVHVEEKNQIATKSNGSYTLKNRQNILNDSQMSDICQPDDRIEEIRLEEISIDKIRLEEISKEPKGSMSVRTDAEPTNHIDWDDIKDVWNKKSMLTEVRSITEKRKKHLNARIKEHGLQAIYEVIDQVSQSDFMHGENNRKWMATFDWVFSSPNNFLKTLEGNYNNNNSGNKNTYKDDVKERVERMKKYMGVQS
jgi:predicted DNA binding CopG/RHH family protein